MSRVVRCPEGTLVEMHDNPCATPDDYEKVKQQLVQAGRAVPRLVVDCAAVHAMGAPFLSALVYAFRILGARPGDIVLCRLEPLSQQVLSLTRLDRLFPIYPTREQALAADWPEPEPLLVDARRQDH